MNISKSISFILLQLILITLSCGKKTNSIQDYLSTGKEIIFGNIKYNLAWSSHPSVNYYKQEYITEKDTLEKFKKMILLEVITGKPKLREVLDSKVAELKKLKESDPMVNYEMFEKDGEIMLDFILSKNMSDRNDADIVERNVYRYKSFAVTNGEEGVLMFGVSERAYGEDIDRFLLALKGNRFDLPNTAGVFVIPEITITK